MTAPYSRNPVTQLLEEDRARARAEAERRAARATVLGTLVALGVTLVVIAVQLHG